MTGTAEPGIEDLVETLLDRHPDNQPYLVYRDQIITRAALRAGIEAESRLFAGFGIGPGSTVALRVPPSFSQVEALLALWRLGAQVILFDHRLKPAETATLTELCRPQHIVKAAGSVDRAVVGFRPRYELLNEWGQDGRPATAPHRLIQFSSGSTGLPKVIGRTPASLATEIETFGRLPNMPGLGDRVLLLSSTVHSFGLGAGLLHSLAVGGTVVFSSGFLGRDLLAAAAAHRVNAIFGVPFHYEILSATKAVPALPDLRMAVSAGEIMARETAARFAELYGLPVGESYGTTETGVIAMDTSGALRPSVGPLVPGVVARIRDGELDVRMDESPYLHGTGDGRYLDGWLRTRDRAELTETGVRLAGRSDSLVVIGGLKVDLTEVESVLRTHPAVTEAVLVHADSIEAYVCLDSEESNVPSVSELTRWCADRVAGYKLPKLIKIVPKLPRTANGKLIREQLRLREALSAIS